MHKNLIVILSIMAMLFSGCGSSTSKKKKIDIANYLPNTTLNKVYTHVTKIDGKLTNQLYTDSVIVESNLVTVKKNIKLYTLVTIKSEEIEVKYFEDTNHSKIINRNLTIGDTVSNYLKRDSVEILKIGSQNIGKKYTKIEEICTLDSMIDHYEKFFFEYTNYDDNHDIMKIECITKTVTETRIDTEYVDSVSYSNGVVESKDDLSYIYLQKNLGMIATINDDCLASKLPDIIDDTLEPDQCLGERYEYNLYQPQY